MKLISNAVILVKMTFPLAITILDSHKSINKRLNHPPQNNKKTVFRAGGLDTLLRCLLQNQAIPSVAEPLLCTLRHINYKCVVLLNF